MKNSRTCTKCSSSDVVRIPGQVGPFGTGNNVPTGLTIFSSVKVTRYLCADCGFCEEWIVSPKDRQKLKSKFRR